MKTQHMKLITSDKTFAGWRSRKSKLKKVLAALNSAKNAGFSIDVEYRNIVPDVVKGRITTDWMDSISAPEKKRGYQFVGYHMSGTQKTVWGITPSTRGIHQRDTDAVSEVYFWADENTKRGKFNQFIETFLHELRHAIIAGIGIEDDTHAIHDAEGTITGAFVQLDIDDFHPYLINAQQQVSKLAQAVGYLTQLFSTKPALLTAAVNSLGRDISPNDLAPDIVGCAESVSMVIRQVLADFPIILGTWTLNDRLQSDRRFVPVTEPTPGCIIISPTGTVQGASYPGHVGIVGNGGVIMSNNSYSGDWEANYTLESWQKKWGTEGYPTYYYKLIV